MRNYFKKTKYTRFDKFCKENGANYTTDEFTNYCGIWIKPEISNTAANSKKAAIRLDEAGDITFGNLNPSCENFESVSNSKVPETQKWIISVLTKIQKYHK